MNAENADFYFFPRPPALVSVPYLIGGNRIFSNFPEDNPSIL